MDMDATIKGVPVSKENIKIMFNEILDVDINDSVTMIIKKIDDTRDEADYAGFRVSLETVRAQKLETMILRGTTNTRMRDFYDVYILTKLQSDNINHKLLAEALNATASVMQDLWKRYKKNYDYAEAISWSLFQSKMF